MSDVPAASAAEAVAIPTGAPVAETPPVVEPAAPGSIAETPPPEAPGSTVPDAPDSLLSGDEAKPAEAGAAEAAEAAESATETPKPEEAKPPGETKPEGEGQPEPTEPLRYEPPELPEGVTLDNEKLASFDAAIGAHQVPAEVRQGLINLHVEQMRAYADHLAQEQHRVFHEMRRQWVSEFENDPELGGNRRDTTIANGIWLRKAYGGSEADAHELGRVLSFTGAGDHPLVIRFFDKLATALRERGAPPPPLPQKLNGGGGRPEERRYGDMRV